jgi:hypothetical protein
MLIAIRDHFTVEDRGAIGYVGMSAEERQQLAYSSRTFACRSCGYKPKPRADDDKIPPPLPSSVRPRPMESGLNNSHLIGFLMVLVFAVLVLAMNYMSN